ncbi:hypothetical protein ABNF97_33650 [Plantactinospora sp. B6F1]|uniref:hypothetical protein n=1 Tax=Plantactinospora sp. B6F1 TaxID=3158971 RepID=UPI00102BB727
MPAWRLGRFIGSLLVLAVLAVGGFAASAGAVGWSERNAVVASELSGDEAEVTEPEVTDPEVTDPEGDVHAFGFEWG